MARSAEFQIVQYLGFRVLGLGFEDGQVMIMMPQLAKVELEMVVEVEKAQGAPQAICYDRHALHAATFESFLHAGPVDTGKEKPQESWDDDDWGPNWGGTWGYLASIMSS